MGSQALPSICLFGRHASGKSTLTTRLKSSFSYTPISIGELCKSAFSLPELSPDIAERAVESYQTAGMLEADDVEALVRAAIRPEQGGQFCFDGFPRVEGSLATLRELQAEGLIGRVIGVEMQLDVATANRRAIARNRPTDMQEGALELRERLFREEQVPCLREFRRRYRVFPVDASFDEVAVFDRVVKILRQCDAFSQ